MNCTEFEALIALHVEGDLPEREDALVGAHLHSCATCRDLAADLRRSQALLKTLRYDAIGGEQFSEVRDRVLLNTPPRREPHPAWGMYAAAAGLLVVLGMTILWRHNDKTTPVRAPAPQIAASIPPPFEPTVQVEPRPKIARRKRITRNAKAEIDPPRSIAKFEPLVIKLLTDDPDVVIYWLVDKNGG